MVPTVPVLEQDATSVPVEPDLLAPRRQHLACHVGHTGSTGEHPWLPIDDAHRAQEELHHEHARQKKRPAMDLSAGVGQQLNPTSSQAEWRSAAEELARAGVWVTLVSLVRHATAHWIAYTVHRTTVERHCLLVSAVVIFGFWQCLVFVLGRTSRPQLSARARDPSPSGTELRTRWLELFSRIPSLSFCSSSCAGSTCMARDQHWRGATSYGDGDHLGEWVGWWR